MSLNQINTKELIQQNFRDFDQINLEATNISQASQKALKEYTEQFEMNVKSLKLKHSMDMSKKDFTIKILVFSVIILSICTVSLATKLIINKI